MMKQITAVFIMYVMVILLLIPGVQAAGPKPVPDFSSDIKEGPAPLSVSFTDLSSNDPAGWAWYFGDETYTEPWTQMTPHAAWEPLNYHRSVALPDGSIVLTGGYDCFEQCTKGVWRSTDYGATWVLMNASAGWLPRWVHTSVVLPDGSIILLGGFDDGRGGTGDDHNDVWRSTDEGATWTQVTANAEWSGRQQFGSVVMPDGSIVLMGGGDQNQQWNDVWRSTDEGATWTQVTANAEWSPRVGHNSVILPDDSIILMGGSDWGNGHDVINDVWRSTDGGATWTQVTANAEWSARMEQNSVVMPDGSIVLIGGDFGGYDNNINDVWRSTDGGATWTQVTANAAWSAKRGQASVVMPDGSIVLMGGDYNGVWRLMPVGSSEQNPSHIYTKPGTYQVSLQVYNEGGFNSIRKSEYINVFASDAGNITVTSNPSRTEIFLDGKDTRHITPFTIPNVAEGNHQVSVIKDCFISPDPQNIVVIAGETVTTDFTLQSTGSCIPEFPSMVVPAVVLVGCIGVMIFFGSRKQGSVHGR